MKEEIKEILELLNTLKKTEDYLSFSEANKLLDYIINLQKDNEKLKEIEKEHKNCTRKYWQQKCAEHYANEMIYKQRNEKAIEYINENKHLSMFADCREPEEDWNYDLEINPRELLNILKGDKDE